MRRVPALDERAAVDLLALHPAAHFTVHNTEWKISITPMPPMPSACTPITAGMVHDAEPAIPVTPLPQMHQHARWSQKARCQVMDCR